VDAALNRLKAGSAFDWVIFTSANGVSHTKTRLMQIGLDSRVFAGCKIAAIGAVSAEAVRRELCLNVDLCPEQFVAEALADALVGLGAVAGKRFLLLRAEISRPILRERLVKDGAAEVSDIAVYETRRADNLPVVLREALAAKRVHWVTFTSSSTAKNFFELLGEDSSALLEGVRIATIGPITTATLRELGVGNAVEAKQFDIEGLVQAVLRGA
jgi:uroporphyrinogen III methyltransferase/synthase